MVLPTVPGNTLSMSNIRAEFGGSTPIFISNYYGGGAYVPSGIGVPTSGQIAFSQFSGKSASGTTYANNVMAAFSVRRLIPTYTGPVIRMRKATDTSGTNQQDFYSDAQQTYLTTAANGTGTSYASWVSGTTGYITKMYDQSGGTNHATATTQPYLISVGTGGKWVIRWTRTSGNVFNLTNTIQPKTIYSHFYFLIDPFADYGTIVTTQYDYELRFYGGTVNGGNNGGDWYYSAGGTKLSYVNGVSSTSLVRTNGWNIMSLSTTAPVWTTDQTSGGTASFNRIGADGYNSSQRAIDGYMTEIMFHSAASTSTNMMDYYASALNVA